MACPDDTAIDDFLAGAADKAAEARMREHLAGCDDCRQLVGATAKSIGAAGAEDVPRTTTRAIGRYVVLEILGAGAMGIVYAAYDPQLDRKVALKLLRADLEGPDGARRLQERLTREAKAMARLSHENVVMVHDAGTFEDRVFVAMELVDGVSLTAWLKLAPRRFQDVLALYVRAGRGLAAAHRAGLVHRDFKPDNVLVGKDGRPRVTDFGLARSVVSAPVSMARLPDESSAALPSSVRPSFARGFGETLAGTLAGTPAYMAPEQLLGKAADGRSDQFAFAVALYEGVYGESPFRGGSLDDRATEVIEGNVADAPKGSRVPAWLRRALLRALRPAANERYASMEAFLAALEQRSWRVRRRVVVPVVVAALAVAGLVGYRVAAREQATLCGGASLKLRGVWDAESRSAAQAAFVATAAPYAEDSWKKSAKLIDDYAARWAMLYTEGCEATRVRGEQSAELLDLRVACLDDRLRRLSGLTKVFAEADRTVVEKAVGAVEELPSLDFCADPAALRSTVRPPADRATAARVEALRKTIAEGAALEYAGQYKQALAVAEPAVRESRTLMYLPVEAEAVYQLGVVQGRIDDKAALPTLEEAAAVAEAASHHRVAALAWIDLAFFVGYGQARFEEGRRWLRYAAVAIDKLGGDDELDAQRRKTLGLLAWGEGKNAEALTELTAARALFEKTLGPTHTAVGKTLNAIALVEFNLGKFDAARAFGEQALAIDEQAYGPIHPSVAIMLNNLGNSLWRLGRYDDAEKTLRRSLDIAVETVGPDHVDTFTALDSLGSVLTSMHRTDEALTTLKRARTILEKAGRVAHPDYAAVLNDLGEAQRERGAYAEARALHRQALGILEESVGADHPDVAMTCYVLGEAWRAEGRFPEAVQEETKALAVVDAPTNSVPSNTARVLTGLGESMLGQNDAKGARPLLERALRLSRDAKGEPSELARTEFAAARALWDTGDRDGAVALGEEAQATFAGARYFTKEVSAVRDWLGSRRP